MGQPKSYTAEHPVLPWHLEIQLDANVNDFLDNTAISIFEQGPARASMHAPTKSHGSLAHTLIDGESNTYWHADLKNDNYIIFKFQR